MCVKENPDRKKEKNYEMFGANTQKLPKSELYGKDEGGVKKTKMVNPLPS